MKIDFEMMRRERAIDPFAFAPVDIEDMFALTAGLMLDAARTNPEVAKGVGTAVCRSRWRPRRRV